MFMNGARTAPNEGEFNLGVAPTGVLDLAAGQWLRMLVRHAALEDDLGQQPSALRLGYPVCIAFPPVPKRFSRLSDRSWRVKLDRLPHWPSRLPCGVQKLRYWSAPRPSCVGTVSWSVAGGMPSGVALVAGSVVPHCPPSASS